MAARKRYESPRQKAERLAREKRLKQKAAAAKRKKAKSKLTKPLYPDQPHSSDIPGKKTGHPVPRRSIKKPKKKVSAPEYEFPFSVSLMRKFHGPKVSAKYRKAPDEKKLQKEVMERDYEIASRKTPKKKPKPVKYKAAYKEVKKKKAAKKVISAVKPDMKKKDAPKKVVVKKAPSKKAPAKKKYLGKYKGIDFIQKARRKKIGIKADERAGRVGAKAKKAVKTKDGTYVKYEKDSASAKSFRSTFKAKCVGDAKEFKWQGRRYSCKKA